MDSGIKLLSVGWWDLYPSYRVIDPWAICEIAVWADCDGYNDLQFFLGRAEGYKLFHEPV